MQSEEWMVQRKGNKIVTKRAIGSQRRRIMRILTLANQFAAGDVCFQRLP